MSRARAFSIAGLGAAFVGGTIYATRSPQKQSVAEMKRNKADRARDLGLGSAGVGGTHLTGGPEAGAAPSRPDDGDDHAQRVKTTAESGDKLPSGGVGGGEGAGGSSARRTEVPFGGRSYRGVSENGEQKKQHEDASKSSSAPDSSSKASTEKAGWLGSLTSSGRVGSKSIASKDDEAGLHNTKGISQMGQDVPSKKGSPVSN
ncbi:hypothetical protein E4U21_002326 [Claviceps maximensis]|nr:hypothetical protein E4U21_002326 [Claviceps maximensis]